MTMNMMTDCEYVNGCESLCTPSKFSVFAQTSHILGKYSDSNLTFDYHLNTSIRIWYRRPVERVETQEDNEDTDYLRNQKGITVRLFWPREISWLLGIKIHINVVFDEDDYENLPLIRCDQCEPLLLRVECDNTWDQEIALY